MTHEACALRDASRLNLGLGGNAVPLSASFSTRRSYGTDVPHVADLAGRLCARKGIPLVSRVVLACRSVSTPCNKVSTVSDTMADQESKDFSEDIADQNFAEQNGDAENGGAGGDVTDNSQESQEDRSAGANQDSLNDRKLFVGGLSWETTDKELREHFSTYGDIESINVKTDPNTGRSRGFAFIVFAKAESLDKIMSAGDHVINNKKVDPKKAKARHGKIFVGGLSTELSDDDIKSFFSQFGTIVEVEMPFDKTKNQRKGFCFITFESEQVVNELLKTSKQTINGKEVDVKKATPKPDGMISMRGGPGGRGGRGVRGGGRGRGFGQGGWGQGGYGGYGGSGYGQGGYGGGYDGYGYDYYGGGGYGGYGYDYSGYDGYGGYGGGNYDGGYSGGRGGARGKGGSGYGGGKQRGGRQNQRHQPY